MITDSTPLDSLTAIKDTQLRSYILTLPLVSVTSAGIQTISGRLLVESNQVELVVNSIFQERRTV